MIGEKSSSWVDTMKFGHEKDQNYQSFFQHKCISYLESHQLISNF